MRKIQSTGPTSPSIASASVSATTMKTSWKTQGRVMWFLLRAAFWLSIVIVLLPTPDSVKMPESNVGAAQAVSAASATMSDMRQFCARQPDACEVGSAALTQFGHKAQASAKWVYEFLSDEARIAARRARQERAEGGAGRSRDVAEHTYTHRRSAGMARSAAAGRGEALSRPARPTTRRSLGEDGSRGMSGKSSGWPVSDCTPPPHPPISSPWRRSTRSLTTFPSSTTGTIAIAM